MPRETKINCSTYSIRLRNPNSQATYARSPSKIFPPPKSPIQNATVRSTPERGLSRAALLKSSEANRFIYYGKKTNTQPSKSFPKTLENFVDRKVDSLTGEEIARLFEDAGISIDEQLSAQQGSRHDAASVTFKKQLLVLPTRFFVPLAGLLASDGSVKTAKLGAGVLRGLGHYSVSVFTEPFEVLKSRGMVTACVPNYTKTEQQQFTQNSLQIEEFLKQYKADKEKKSAADGKQLDPKMEQADPLEQALNRLSINLLNNRIVDDDELLKLLGHKAYAQFGIAAATEVFDTTIKVVGATIGAMPLLQLTSPITYSAAAYLEERVGQKYNRRILAGKILSDYQAHQKNNALDEAFIKNLAYEIQGHYFNAKEANYERLLQYQLVPILNRKIYKIAQDTKLIRAYQLFSKAKSDAQLKALKNIYDLKNSLDAIELDLANDMVEKYHDYDVMVLKEFSALLKSENIKYPQIKFFLDHFQGPLLRAYILHQYNHQIEIKEIEAALKERPFKIELRAYLKLSEPTKPSGHWFKKQGIPVPDTAFAFATISHVPEGYIKAFQNREKILGLLMNELHQLDSAVDKTHWEVPLEIGKALSITEESYTQHKNNLIDFNKELSLYLSGGDDNYHLINRESEIGRLIFKAEKKAEKAISLFIKNKQFAASLFKKVPLLMAMEYGYTGIADAHIGALLPEIGNKGGMLDQFAQAISTNPNAVTKTLKNGIADVASGVTSTAFLIGTIAPLYSSAYSKDMSEGMLPNRNKLAFPVDQDLIKSIQRIKSQRSDLAIASFNPNLYQ